MFLCLIVDWEGGFLNRINPFFAIVLLSLFFAGCVSMEYGAEQRFADDGSSVLKTTEKTSFSEAFLSMYKGTGSGREDKGSIIVATTLGFYSDKAYPEAVCSVLEDEAHVTKIPRAARELPVGSAVPEGVACTPYDDGAIGMERTLKPGEFYEFESATDWINLKERRTYRINSVPSHLYFLSGRETELQQAIAKALADYAGTRLDGRLKKDFYCENSGSGISSLSGFSFPSCSFAEYKNGYATVSLSVAKTTSPPQELRWVGCSDKSAASLMLKNAAELEKEVHSKTPVNKPFSTEKPITVQFSCPAGSHSLVAVVYYPVQVLIEDYSKPPADPSAIGLGGLAYDIKSKAEMKKEILDALEASATANASVSLGSATLGGAATTDYSKMVLDFRKRNFFGSDLEKLGGASAYGMEVNVDYRAVFQERIASAEMGGKSVKFQGNEVSLSMEKISKLPAGVLAVVTEKEIFPFGVFAWVALGIFLAVLVGILIFAAMKKQPPEQPKPPEQPPEAPEQPPSEESQPPHSPPEEHQSEFPEQEPLESKEQFESQEKEEPEKPFEFEGEEEPPEAPLGRA